MALTKFGFLVTGNGFNPARDVQLMQTAQFTMIIIGCATAADGPAAARQLVAEGVQLIELCGGFGPIWTARIIDAIGDAVPIGAVAYGPETIDRLHAIFSE
jgi:predicted polyphosphate/ATP-dependent NAD kinase